MEKEEQLATAKNLIDEFTARTGLNGKGDIQQRYLWTDAFAVQTLFGLAHATGEEKYHNLALKLIDQVHLILGRYREDDEREGWISGLPEEQGRSHPTLGGLRIGKKYPERKKEAPYNEIQEWQTDGQYFHYLTRWMQALLQAAKETSDKKYAVWAAELAQAGQKFIVKEKEGMHMYWKMSTDLSRPLVPSMGAHDPLEGAILSKSIKQAVPEKAADLDPIIEDMETLCLGRDWSTDDPLGIGGLLLNYPRAVELRETRLPPSLLPEKLLEDAKSGLAYYKASKAIQQPAYQRLAFRECGLSLGIRVLDGLKNKQLLKTEEINDYLHLAKSIENFWSRSENQEASTWKNHEDINAISLAASLTAAVVPESFT